MLNTWSPSMYAVTKTYGQRTSWLCGLPSQLPIHAPIGREMTCDVPSNAGLRSNIRSGVYWYSVSLTTYRPSGLGVNVCPPVTPEMPVSEAISLGSVGL